MRFHCVRVRLCMFLLALTPVIAQPPAATPAAPPEDVEAALVAEVDALLAEAEVEPVVAVFVRSELLEGDDPMRAMTVLLRPDGPGTVWFSADPFRGLESVMPPTVTVLSPEKVLIVDGHTAYVLNTTTMKVEGTAAYARPDAAKRLQIVRAIRAMRSKAEAARRREREAMGERMMDEARREEIGGEGDPDATLTAHLTTLQNAVDLFNNDMGFYPQTLEETARTDNPDPDYNGPYIRAVPRHPFGGVYGLDPQTGQVWEKH